MQVSTITLTDTDPAGAVVILNHRPLHRIARDIISAWHKPSPYALPYIQAMAELQSIEDNYWLDSGHEIVARFLANAGSWRGDTARTIKAELKQLAGIK
jgi:hypothetical protein